MATRRRRRLQPTRKVNPDADLREDVRDAIERAWPDGVVGMAFDSDESWLWDVYPKLATAIQRIKGACLVHEREPDGEPAWFDNSGPEDDPPDDQEASRSYHLFFVSPDGKAFTYETEIERPVETDWDEEESENELTMETLAGNVRAGWLVAVSLLAPFAVITFGELTTFEDGSGSEPSIESLAFTEAGQEIDPEAEFRKSTGEKAFETLLRLRSRICAILSEYGIGVLSEEEWHKPVSWLRADESIFALSAGAPVRVLNALFFEGF
jgi:hypothetical protein